MANAQNILDALDFPELSLEEQEEILLDLNELIFSGTLVRLIEQMNDTTRVEFEALVERDASVDEVEEFLAKRVPGSQKAVEETIQEMTDDILAVTKK